MNRVYLILLVTSGMLSSHKSNGQFPFSAYKGKSWHMILKSDKTYLFNSDTTSEVQHLFYLPKERKFYQIEFKRTDSSSFTFMHNGIFMEFTNGQIRTNQLHDSIGDSIYFRNPYFYYPPVSRFEWFDNRFRNNMSNRKDTAFYYEKNDSLYYAWALKSPFQEDGITVEGMWDQLVFHKKSLINCSYEFHAGIPGGKQYEKYTILYADTNLTNIYATLVPTLHWIDSIKANSKEFVKESSRNETEISSPVPGGKFELFQDREYLRIIDTSKGFSPELKYTLIDFWYTGCIPCRKNFPGLDSLYNEFKEKVEFLGVNTKDMGSRKAFAMETLKLFNIPYVNVFYSDQDARLAGIWVYPTILVIDRSGKVLKIVEGHSPSWVAEMRAFLNALPE